jgi:hypothetical protein
VEHFIHLLYSNAPYKSGEVSVVDSKIVNIFSDSSSPTSITFSSSTSTGSPFFTLTTGKLYCHDLIFIYDSSTVDTFILLAGVGSVVMQSVIIRASNTSATVANNSFIVINRGRVEFKQLTFQSFRSSVGVISFVGNGYLLLSESAITNITFSGNGAFIRSFSSPEDKTGGVVNVVSSNFSSISGVGNNGSVIHVDGFVSSVLIYDCMVGGSINAGNGGAFYIVGCFCSFNSSKFVNCVTGENGRGGAVFFGRETSFVLFNDSFTNCYALYGGAIYSMSELKIPRIISDVNFTNNLVQTGGNGNDIFDNSSIGGLLYSKQTVTNSLSASAATDTVFNFYLAQDDVDLDCLLSESNPCSIDPIYVGSDGVDSLGCGSFFQQCRSVTQALANLIDFQDTNAVINVGEGDYNDVVLVVEYMTLGVVCHTNDRPILSCASPPMGIIFLYLFDCICYIFLIVYIFLVCRNFCLDNCRR